MPAPNRLLQTSLAMFAALAALTLTSFAQPRPKTDTAQLTLTVIDQATMQPVPFRIHIKNQANRPARVNAQYHWENHTYGAGKLDLNLLPGGYVFEIDPGPEYKLTFGHFAVDRTSQDQKVIQVQRHADLAKLGWYAGDLHVQRPEKILPLILQAENVHFVANVGWGNKKTDGTAAPPEPRWLQTDDGRWIERWAGRDARGTNGVGILGLEKPLSLLSVKPDEPFSVVGLQAAREAGAWLDVQLPASVDLPLWVALAKPSSFQLAHSRLQRETTVFDPKTGGWPRDALKFKGIRGEGMWTTEIYYHLLNCGILIPPTAGSGTGVVPNPLGYNRVYAHVEDELTAEKWWDSLRAGRVFVSNGPLLMARVQDQLPGHTFTAPGGGEDLVLQAELTLHTRDKISYLELVRNGEVAHSLRLDEVVKENGKMPELRFQESGWFLLRAVVDDDKTYRFASTGPFYVRLGGEPYISRRSVTFFADWLAEREKQIAAWPESRRMPIQPLLDEAKEFWALQLKRANAE